jgi:beta-galactosidase
LEKLIMLLHGACYYPEHWTAEQARHHIPLMQKAGINVVRMGEFAWFKFEPEMGRYRFDWLDTVIAELHKAGIRTIICTPTCIPPAWGLQRYPNILQKDADGHVRNPGSRCYCCKNAPAYQALCNGVVREMARHYAGMPGVIGWQIDNELGCHNTTRCYCEHCEKAFRDWVQAKYKENIDAVNENWGTSFWGMEIRNWNAIFLPKTTPAGPNPGHWLDFARFSSDAHVNFVKLQYELIKAACPDHFVTHNLMGRFPEIDYYQLAKYTDFPVWDNYPDSYADPYVTSYSHEITRSLKGRYIVMEQKSGPTGDAITGVLGEQPDPGEIRRWAWQSIANGADGLVYFRWRASLYGQEQYWHGILDHDGVPRRRYSEVRKIAEELLKATPDIDGTRAEIRVAMIRSFESLWSIERQPGMPGFKYDDHCFQMYRAVKQNGHGCDIISPDADFMRYPVIIAPCLNLVDEKLAARLDEYARSGGTLIFTPQSGTRLPSNIMIDQTKPGFLSTMAGIAIEEVRPYHHGQTNEIQFAKGPLIARTATVGDWVEVLQSKTAESIAELRDEPFTGRPVITRNAHGKGNVYYMGVYLPEPLLKEFLGGILPEFPVKDIPEGVEITLRRGQQRRIVFVINNTRERQTVTLPGTFQDILSGEQVGPKVLLSQNGVLVLRS